MLYDIILLLISLLFVVFVLKKILPGRGVGQMEASTLKKELADHPDELQLIDVRKPEKYQQFHIHGFQNIPLNAIRKQAKELDTTKKTILICRTGTQGNEACKRLRNRGFKNIHNVRGGLSTWDPPRTPQK